MSGGGSDERSFRDFRRIADKELVQKQALGAAAAAVEKRLRMRRFTWCRAANEVYDDKVWRLVARMAGAPLHLVEAMVLRLDLHASAAKPRGTLDGFSIPALAAHWNMANDDVLARIYAALEHPEIGWIEQDHLVTFWPRNPDTEDATAADRVDRSRAFKRAMKAIAGYARTGAIDAAGRLRLEKELHALRDEARRTHPARAELHRRLDQILHLSTEEGGCVVTSVTAVTVTPRSDQIYENGEPVDNAGAAAGGTVKEAADKRTMDAGPAREADAELWLSTEGKRLVVSRLIVTPQLAETTLERWRRELDGGHAVLAEILRGLSTTVHGGVRFTDLVLDRIKAWRATASDAPQLNLPAVIGGTVRKVGR